MIETIHKTIKVRVRDKHSKVLSQMSVEVNSVWHYCNDLNRHHYHQTKKFVSEFGFNYFLKGWSKTESQLIGSSTVQATAGILAKSTFLNKKPPKWRKSYGKRRNLGWVPFKAQAVKIKSGMVFFAGRLFQVWDSFGLDKYKFKAGSFVEDASGRWFFTVVVEIPSEKIDFEKQVVGIDLGFKHAATTSDGDFLKSCFFRKYEKKLAALQKIGKHKRATKIRLKIKNCRLDSHHKFSRYIVNKYEKIRVGNVSSRAMIGRKKGFAKSALDASWYQLKSMLKYKSQQACRDFEIVNEEYTTQTCSSCNHRSGPKGLKGAGIRQWTCINCGTSHDRDINSAKIIAGLGH